MVHGRGSTKAACSTAMHLHKLASFESGYILAIQFEPLAVFASIAEPGMPIGFYADQ